MDVRFDAKQFRARLEGARARANAAEAKVSEYEAALQQKEEKCAALQEQLSALRQTLQLSQSLLTKTEKIADESEQKASQLEQEIEEWEKKYQVCHLRSGIRSIKAQRSPSPTMHAPFSTRPHLFCADSPLQPSPTQDAKEKYRESQSELDELAAYM
ncbi:hypothetical protein C8Q79DRAFT_266206 [Trametes meyenii]|nr:hypothetical protein C8Q79DRAFT_266206 [Trametes meyenii]